MRELCTIKCESVSGQVEEKYRVSVRQRHNGIRGRCVTRVAVGRARRRGGSRV